MFGLTDKILAIAAGAGALVLGVLLVIQTGALHKAERRADKAEVALATAQASYADERTKAADALVLATTKARHTEQQLTAQAEKAENEKQTQLAVVAARADDLRKRLRNAEANAATARLVSKTAHIASNPEATGVDNVAGFSGESGNRLVSEAERGEQIRVALLACYKQYEQARVALGQ